MTRTALMPALLIATISLSEAIRPKTTLTENSSATGTVKGRLLGITNGTIRRMSDGASPWRAASAMTMNRTKIPVMVSSAITNDRTT